MPLLILTAAAVFAVTLAGWHGCLALADALERLTRHRPNP